MIPCRPTLVTIAQEWIRSLKLNALAVIGKHLIVFALFCTLCYYTMDKLSHSLIT